MFLEDNNTGTTLLWFLGGALLGATVALLLAPEKGAVTRKRIIKTAKRSRKAVGESGQEIVNRGRELYERGREIAEEAAELFERGRNVAEKKINDVI